MFESLCTYKDALGQPATGIHAYRVANIAIADVIMTLAVAYIISLLFQISFVYSAMGMFIAGIILHRLFCVRTTVDKMLFSEPRVSNILEGTSQ